MPVKRALAPLLMCLFVLSIVRAYAQDIQPIPPTKADVAYGEADGKPLLLDVYEPKEAGGAARRPAVILIHGGGWESGDKQSPPQALFGTMLSKLGYVCFSIDYRLVHGRQNTFPAQIDDAQRAVRWVRAHADKYHIAPNRMAAIGDSAGGHLVSLLGTMETRDNSIPALSAYSSRVQFVVDICGPSDFALEPSGPLDQMRAQILSKFMGKKFKDDPEAYRQASPLYHVSAASASFLILHGTLDPLVPISQSEKFKDALQKAGVEATLVKFEGEGHGFTQPANRIRAYKLTAEFLQKHLPI